MSRSLFVPFATVLLSTSLSGCVPVRSAYYEPVQGARVGALGSSCSMEKRKVGVVELDNDVKLEFRALPAQSHRKESVLWVTVYVPPFSVAQLMSDSARLIGDDGATRRAEIGNIKVVRHASPNALETRAHVLGSTDLMEGGELRTRSLAGIEKRPYGYQFSIDLGLLPEQVRRNFAIELPVLLVNNHEQKVHPVAFSLREETHLAGLCQ